MSTYESVVTSWRMRSVGNGGAKSSGPTGCLVAGGNTGGGGDGRSGMMLYQRVGISDSSSRIRVSSAMRARYNGRTGGTGVGYSTTDAASSRLFGQWRPSSGLDFG